MISFNFVKKREPTNLVTSELREEEEPAEELDFVQSIEGTKIKGTKQKPEKTKLIIPLITKNNWRIISSPGHGDNDNECDPVSSDFVLPENDNRQVNLEQQAIQELLGANNENADVPLIFQNRVPSGYENDDNLNVSLRPDESTLDDYERIPIEEFGMAVLRGMGWKKGEGIGLRNKRVVEVVEPRLRPKGLGLGAERPLMTQEVIPNSGCSTGNENLTLKKGAFIILNRGKNKGMYGKVEAFDEDNNRVIVQLAINGTMITISKYGISLVTEIDFRNKSKVLNNELYEEYKRKDEERAANRESENTSRLQAQDLPLQPTTSRNKGHHHHRQKEESVNSNENVDWVSTNLRVRIIDSKFKRGKHYKKKFIVEDVLERDNFVLKSETGEIVEGLKSLQLETVIPKELQSLVKILSGQHKGKIGQLIDRDSKNEIGVVQIPDEGVLELTFNDICEFVGNLDDFF